MSSPHALIISYFSAG